MVNTQHRAFAHAGSQEPGTKGYPALSNALFHQAHSVRNVSSHHLALQGVDAEQGVIDTMVERAVHAQRAFLDWSEERIDQLLQALAESVSMHAEDLAIAAVQETRLGNVADKTAKNREETTAFLDVMVDPVSQRFKPHVNGQAAADLAAQVGISRPYPIRLLVMATEEVGATNPLAVEKLAPILSLFTVADEYMGMHLCQALLALDGLGHTAIIHTNTSALVEAFAARMPASRILVNAPGTQAGIGMTSGLLPSLTLGCGTFGGTSTTDNVSYSHLLNIKRVAYYTAPKTLSGPGSSRPWFRPDLLVKAGMAVVWRQFFRLV